jgi:hypothetical protein
MSRVPGNGSPARARRRQRHAGWRWVFAALLAMAASVASVQGTPPRVLAFESVLDGSEEEPLRWPVALAVVSNEELAVADAWRPRLMLFRRVGVSWGVERVVTLAAAPAAVAFDGAQYVVAPRGGGLVNVGRDGAVAPRATPKGLVVGALAAFPGRALLVYDRAGRRVVRLDEGGAIVAQTVVRETVTGLVADGAGGFWMAIGEAGEVRRVSAAGELVERWKVPGDAPEPAWPAGVAVEPGGRLFVLDRHGGRILALDGEGRAVGVGGREGWDVGLLRYPSALARLPNGGFVVADQGNGRVQTFRLLGTAGP